jgi:hypothetical protein
MNAVRFLNELNKMKKKVLVKKIMSSNVDKIPNRENIINKLSQINNSQMMNERNSSSSQEEEKMSVDELSVISSDSISSQ